MTRKFLTPLMLALALFCASPLLAPCSNEAAAAQSEASPELVAYARAAKQAVMANWQTPELEQAQDLFAVVEIQLGKGGKIKKCRLVEASGNQEFDASVLKAVSETGKLPPAPTGVQALLIKFNK